MKGRRSGIRTVLRPTNNKRLQLHRVQKTDNLVYMYGKLSDTIGILITNHGDARNRV
jgi:hypothetical protein